MVNMAADDTIDLLPPGLLGDHTLKLTDEVDGLLDPRFARDENDQ